MKIKKNGKIITLTESDLKRIAGVVLREDAKGDPGTDFVKCCKEAGIDPSKVPSCVAGNTAKCMEELGTMISSDPLGMGMKALVALNCLKDKLKSPVMNESEEIEGTTTLDVELEEVDENDPDPTKVQVILDKVENFLKNSVDGDLPKNLQKFKRKIKNLFNKHGKSTHGKLKSQCSRW